MNELKSCPFCGGVAQVNTWTMHGITESRCFCPNSDCPNSVRTVALATWNTRPIEDALTARITKLEAAQRWIPVSERLPEDHATILAAFNNREILTAKYYKYYEGFGSVENYWRIEGWHSGNVTHWMPLPESPNDTQTETFVYGKEDSEVQE